MKNFNKHEFDEIFRQGLVAPELNEVDEDWALMKGRLQIQQRRNIVPPYMIFVSSIAAILLLVFAVKFTSDVTLEDPKDISAKNSSNAAQSPEVEDNTLNTLESSQIDQDVAVAATAPLNRVKVNYSNIDSKAKVKEGTQALIAVEIQTTDIPGTADPKVNTSVLELATPEGDLNASVIGEAAIEKPHANDNVTAAEESEENEAKLNSDMSRFSLAINFAPDLNGVEQLQNNKLSYSLGAALVYKISNKLSIEAGAAYGKKTYQTGFSSFRPASYNLFQVKPNVVSSGFDVMDIQLNMDYTLLNKGRSTIGVGAGISSYLMLDEQYSFTYQNLNARGLSSFSTGYQNNHFFGIANLNLSYKRSLTNNIKLAFNPYLKLPLTDLGYGNIRLRSAGMSVGVITNLNKNKK